MRRVSLAVLIVVALLVAACGSDEATSELVITGGETGAAMWFEPPDPVVAPGEHRIRFVNEGTLHHELAIRDPSGTVLVARSIPGKTTATMTVELPAPGVYELLCREPGHTAAGMVGTITVR